MKTTNEIRAEFLEFFSKNNHKIVSSSPLVPQNDPTLMFTNAGMVQFKNLFTGQETRDYTRAVSSQKCVRAGGKHNDLDNVGHTARHHTFFEMLGNFSFGDYFKEDAIKYAWEFLTEILKIPAERLLITVYHTDDEAFNIWKKLTGFPDEKIIRVSSNDNFWAMGDTGPCGPCSEIFYDHGDSVKGTPPPNDDGDRFVEIWNLVFMEYEQLENGDRIPLPKPCIDTGMGLERVAAILQDVHSNYDIDLFKSLIAESAKIAGSPDSVAHCVITDHLRSCSFLIADGVLPSNEGRGYVLRRIMRRAMRYAHQLGCREPLMYKLVPTLIREMGEAYPELKRAEASITETLRNEEARFKTTLGKGLKLLDEELTKTGDILSGDVAFKLYDTYGFPLDLTTDILRGQGKSVDIDGFNEAMEEQKKQARAAWTGSGESATSDIWLELKEKFGDIKFIGYDTLTATAKVIAIIKEDEQVENANRGDDVYIITDRTVFYGESGGQVGDTGRMSSSESHIDVRNTIKPVENFLVHKCVIKHGTVSIGDELNLEVLCLHRKNIRANHSATHLLHRALKDTIGQHVSQKGSLVAEEKLRFDYSHNKSLSLDEIIKVEEIVNRYIRQNKDVVTYVTTPEKAMEEGATALFGEKYGDTVRVVSMGVDDLPTVEHDTKKSSVYSTELCGGTHVEKMGDIGLFKIVSDSAISAGIRRIEAVTGMHALAHVQQQEKVLYCTAQLLKVAPAELENRIKTLLKEKKNLEAELSKVKQKLVLDNTGDVREIAGIKVIAPHIMEGLSPKELKSVVDNLKQQIGSGIASAATVNNGKITLVIGVTKDLTDKYKAGDLVKISGGKGGGRPDMAQAGFDSVDEMHAGFERILAHLMQK